MKPLAVDLAALGDTDPLWRDWLEDAQRRFRIEAKALDDELPNWRQLLGRFAEERAPVYFRRDPAASSALRRLQESGRRIGVFTEAPAELATVVLAHLGAADRFDAVEAGPGARARVVERLGDGVEVVSTRDELLAVT